MSAGAALTSDLKTTLRSTSDENARLRAMAAELKPELERARAQLRLADEASR